MELCYTVTMKQHFSFITWNVQGRDIPRNYNHRKVKKFLKKNAFDVACIQEFPNDKKNMKEIHKTKSYELFLSKSFSHKRKTYNANVILSAFPMLQKKEISFPASDSEAYKKLEHHEECLFTDIHIDKKPVRIYNVHLSVKAVGIKERLAAIKKIMSHAAEHDGPVVIAGDMNTVVPRKGFARKIIQLYHNQPNESMIVDGKEYGGDERYIFDDAAAQNGFKQVTDLMQSTWAVPYTNYELFNLKVDWIFIRDMSIERVKVGKYISDHRAVSCQLTF